MIPQQAVDEVRHGVLQRLRRRKTVRRSATAIVALACLAVLIPRPSKSVPKNEPFAQDTASPRWESGDAKSVNPPIAPSPQASFVARRQLPSRDRKGAVVRASTQSPKPKPEASQRPAYIQIFTDNPDVVFLLLTSDEGGM